ncbi:MAG: PilZ domain-containing protein [Candidatus Omnitrophica bacterium]|nr:PilZ domain-containing protein [Candidatus Omnitrophota bacterium]
MEERRHHPRWQVNIPVKIKLQGAEAFSCGHLLDITLKGMRIAVDFTLPTDSLVTLCIGLSDDCFITIEGKAVWCRNVDILNIYGIIFKRISDYDKDKIFALVKEMHPKQIYNGECNGIICQKGGAQMEDLRIFERMPAQLAVRFIDLKENKEGDAQTLDISAKGMGLVTEQPLGPKTPLELWLKIPDRGEPLYMRGDVVWSKATEESKYRVGVNLEKADLMGLARVMRIA